MHTKFIFCLRILLVLLLAYHPVRAQEAPPVVNRSTIIQKVDGREYYFHAVQQGQTLFSISRAYGISLEEVRKANPEILGDNIGFGQIVRIPVSSTESQVTPTRRTAAPVVNFVEYQVRRRDTLYGISRQFNVSMDKLLEYNPELRQGLRPNMVIRIPQEGPEPEITYVYYTVAPQETKFGLARRFNITIDALESLNPDLVNEGLKAGQVIKIPQETAEVQQPPFLPGADRAGLVAEVSALDPYCANPVLKPVYHVALMIPFRLERLEPGFDTVENPRLPRNHVAFNYIEYYQGVLLAVDSARAQGMNIQLHVYDVCDSVPKARSVLWKPEMAQMDLIIGPFHKNTFELVGDYAKARQIPLVAPYNLDDDQLLRRYPNMFQAVPSHQVQMAEMARYVAATYPEANLILVHGNQPRVMGLIQGFKKSLNEEINKVHFYNDSLNLARINGYFLNGVYVGEKSTNVLVVHDSLLRAQQNRRAGVESSQAYKQYLQRNHLKEVDFSSQSIELIKAQLDTVRPNILISLMGGEPLISNYTRQLSQLRGYNITVFGVPEWARYESLEIDYLQNLKTHIYTIDFIAYNKSHNQDYIRRFRAQNFAEPSFMAYKGTTTAYFFFNALHQYGRDFAKCMERVNRSMQPNSPYRFKTTYGPNTGWENHHVVIYRYQNYELRDISQD